MGVMPSISAKAGTASPPSTPPGASAPTDAGLRPAALSVRHGPLDLAGPANRPNSVPQSAGITKSTLEDVIVIPYNDAEALEFADLAIDELLRMHELAEQMLRDRREHPLIQTAVDVHEFFGFPSRAVATGSTDANAGVVRGVPSISIGRSRGGDQHTLSDWAEAEVALPATRIALLIGLSMAGVPGIQP